jgi:hypothetical protein
VAPNGHGVGTPAAEVRAEREGGGNGRVYHIFFTATDELGAACSGEVLVGVPHDQEGAPAVDDGALYDSTVLAPWLTQVQRSRDSALHLIPTAEERRRLP